MDKSLGLSLRQKNFSEKYYIPVNQNAKNVKGLHGSFVQFKALVRGKFAILHNCTFLSGWINPKVIFKTRKLLRKVLVILRSFVY